MKVKIELEREWNGKIYKETIIGDTDNEPKIGLEMYEYYATGLLKTCLHRLFNPLPLDNPSMSKQSPTDDKY